MTDELKAKVNDCIVKAVSTTINTSSLNELSIDIHTYSRKAVPADQCVNRFNDLKMEQGNDEDEAVITTALQYIR